MTIEETFSEWFRQLDQREQNMLLEYVKDRYFAERSPVPTVETGVTSIPGSLVDPEKRQTVCPTCKREF